MATIVDGAQLLVITVVMLLGVEELVKVDELINVNNGTKVLFITVNDVSGAVVG